MNNDLASKGRALLSLGVLMVLASSGPVRAQPTQDDSSLCTPPGVVFLFFNGTHTTRDAADIALQEFRRQYGSTSPAGERIRYEYLYNYSNGFENVVEELERQLLAQEGLLQGRFELFLEILRGEGPWLSSIVEFDPRTADRLDKFRAWYLEALTRQLKELFASPAVPPISSEHQVRLDNLVLEGRKLLLVAHSQGNWFVNPAYEYAQARSGPRSVKVVHIAPASRSVNGPHTLADLDLVIGGLPAFGGGVVDITDSIPSASRRPAGVGGQRDPLGHGLLEIYLNPMLSISQRLKSHIHNALRTLEPPPATATQGFFTATLTWDGPGDVDLHVTEPSGYHVFYRQKQGESGYLDVDNRDANGPEHFYADCDANRLQTGTYQLSVANYARADRRKATMQIASSNDGVLGTKTVELGAATEQTPSETLFRVVVTQHPETKKYSVALAP